MSTLNYFIDTYQADLHPDDMMYAIDNDSDVSHSSPKRPAKGEIIAKGMDAIIEKYDLLENSKLAWYDGRENHVMCVFKGVHESSITDSVTKIDQRRELCVEEWRSINHITN